MFMNKKYAFYIRQHMSFCSAQRAQNFKLRKRFSWLHSITIEKAHQILAESCYRYLSFEESISRCRELMETITPALDGHVSRKEINKLRETASRTHPFLEYALYRKDYHYNEADHDGLSTVKQLCRDWSRDENNNPLRSVERLFLQIEERKMRLIVYQSKANNELGMGQVT